MSYVNPIWLEGQRKRWTRHDAHRFAPPCVETKLRPSRSDAVAQGALDEDFEYLRWLVRDLKIDLALRRLRLKYSPDQPRVPKGNGIFSGRWGDLGIFAAHDDRPNLPKDRPTSKGGVFRAIREAATWILKNGTAIGRIIKVGTWAYEYAPYVKAYLDSPKGLDELQEAASMPSARGYDDHHIVEQTAAEKDGFPRTLIDGRDNVVRIPTFRHWEITGWYQTKSDEFGGLSPREYLRDKDWDERTRVGLDALKRFGVLKP